MNLHICNWLNHNIIQGRTILNLGFFTVHKIHSLKF